MRSFILILLSGIFLSCGHSGSPKTEQLYKAAALHQQAIDIDEAVQKELDQLISLKNQINVQARSLSPEEMAFVASVEQLQQRHAYWEENHVEVPGFEHEGHEGHDHHHHGPGLELTPADQLIVQQEFVDSILAILNAVQKVKSTAEQLQPAAPALE
ncbi:MAG: hypothetical protein KDC44_04420 [Phaeodactylibacter sp.]|nr:hypothetical protein [Phaeodactylibacter sp.]